MADTTAVPHHGGPFNGRVVDVTGDLPDIVMHDAGSYVLDDGAYHWHASLTADIDAEHVRPKRTRSTTR